MLVRVTHDVHVSGARSINVSYVQYYHNSSLKLTLKS